MKRALITGGSGAIGAAIARSLSQAGIEVILQACRSMERAEELVLELGRHGGVASAISLDLRDAVACETQIHALTEHQAIDVLIHAAGVHADAPMVGMSKNQWQDVIDISLNGFFHVTQPLLMPMIRQRYGRIVCISSVAALTGNRGQSNYAAAKAGLIGAAKSLSQELASRNVLTNVITPGIIDSPMSEGHFDAESIRRLVPMGRSGQPEDVAQLVAFLVSDQAGYITGQVIGVNGGMI